MDGHREAHGAGGGGRRRHPPSPRPVTIPSDGLELAGLLYLPAGEPRGALLVCHGAGSRKENHQLMGEQAVAAGLAALTFDFRGHGQSGGVMDPQGWRDAVAGGELLLRRSGAPWLAARGASMGGCLLLQAAHARPGLFGALALLCPADGRSLLRGLDRLEGPDSADDPYVARFDAPALRPFLARLDLVALARGLRRVMLAHARDDGRCPSPTASASRPSWRRPRASSRWTRAVTTAPGDRPLVARETIAWALAHGAAR